MMLEICNMSSGYRTRQVLYGVSMRLQEREIVCIIGPNGSGKSTLLKTVFGMIKPWDGNVTFQGEDMTGRTPSEILRNGISYVQQGRSIFPHMTVLENLELGAYIVDDQQLVRERTKDVQDRFPVLRDKRREKAGNMSGGEQRMLEIGRALMLDPKVLLLDEPTLGLAPKISNMLFEKVKELNASGVSLVIVEQNAHKALQISNRGYVLELGRNRFEGTGQSLLQDKNVKRLYLGG